MVTELTWKQPGREIKSFKAEWNERESEELLWLDVLEHCERLMQEVFHLSKDYVRSIELSEIDVTSTGSRTIWLENDVELDIDVSH
jgi:hypothetical protein